MATRAQQGEPILLTTPPPLPPETIAAPQGPALLGAAQLDRMDADVKAMQQQALATQKTLDQLQAHEATGSDAIFGTELPVSEGAWGLAAVVLAYALLQAWKKRRGGNMAQAEWDDDSLLPPQAKEKTAPPVAPKAVVATRAAVQRAVVVEPEFADASDSAWGVSHAVELEEPAGFDVQVAASEVARVRNALAQRREARALERAEDARRARALTERARRRSEEFPAWDDSRPFPEVLDVACEDAVASVSIASMPVPFWQRPSERALLVDECDLPVTVQPELAREDEPEDEGGTLPSFDNAYAVKLALAHEAVAVDLWDEARELIQEVLETDDPELQAQAHALLATIEQRENEANSGS